MDLATTFTAQTTAPTWQAPFKYTPLRSRHYPLLLLGMLPSPQRSQHLLLLHRRTTHLPPVYPAPVPLPQVPLLTAPLLPIPMLTVVSLPAMPLPTVALWDVLPRLRLRQALQCPRRVPRLRRLQWAARRGDGGGWKSPAEAAVAANEVMLRQCSWCWCLLGQNAPSSPYASSTFRSRQFPALFASFLLPSHPSRRQYTCSHSIGARQTSQVCDTSRQVNIHRYAIPLTEFV